MEAEAAQVELVLVLEQAQAVVVQKVPEVAQEMIPEQVELAHKTNQEMMVLMTMELEAAVPEQIMALELVMI